MPLTIFFKPDQTDTGWVRAEDTLVLEARVAELEAAQGLISDEVLTENRRYRDALQHVADEDTCPVDAASYAYAVLNPE